MKRYIVFIVSFLLIYFLLQVCSGWFLTMTYSADISDAWEKNFSLPQKVSFGGHSSIPMILVPAIAASFAFFISQKRKRLPK